MPYTSYCHNMAKASLILWQMRGGNCLPNDKILDWSKLKRFQDDKINVTQKHKNSFGKSRKHCGKKRKRWLPAFMLVTSIFFFSLYFQKASYTGTCIIPTKT